MKHLPEITLLLDEPLMNYTFTKTGGPADVLAFPKRKEEVKEIVDYCRVNQIPWMVLGNASNLIVRDGGIRGVVIMLTEMNAVHVEDMVVVAEAGAKLIDTTYAALAESLTGFEFACGIPGSIGGAVYMNAGAYDGEIKDVFAEVDVLLEDGTMQTLTNEEMNFSYRHSEIQKMKAIVLEARFQLKKGDYPQISVFKRPVGHYTGQLIQEAGLQGLKWGGAQISEKHAGFIVNIDHATATDYVELIGHIQQVIKETFDVNLETEVRIIGELAPEKNLTKF